MIAVNEFLGMLIINAYRKEGGKEVNLGDLKNLSEIEQEIMTLLTAMSQAQ